MRNTVVGIGGKPIAVWTQSISGVSAVDKNNNNSLFAQY
jgi:hypothetical protein